MTEPETTFEYAIEIPNRGYVADIFPQMKVVPEIVFGCRTIEEADDILRRAYQGYIQMGCPEIAETLVIVSRAVTVRRSDWAREWPESRRASERLEAKK